MPSAFLTSRQRTPTAAINAMMTSRTIEMVTPTVFFRASWEVLCGGASGGAFLPRKWWRKCNQYNVVDAIMTPSRAARSSPVHFIKIVDKRRDARVVGLVHHRPRPLGRLAQIEGADTFLDPTDIARRHRQVAQAEPEEKGGETRVAGHLAAQIDRDPRAHGRLDRELDQAQDRRMKRVVEIGDLFVAAIDGERVLDQVVGADGKELGFGGQRVGGQRGPGYLD